MVLMMMLHLGMSLCLQKIGPNLNPRNSNANWLVTYRQGSFLIFKLQMKVVLNLFVLLLHLLGAIPTEGIPCLLKVLLPSNCTGLPVLWVSNCFAWLVILLDYKDMSSNYSGNLILCFFHLIFELWL